MIECSPDITGVRVVRHEVVALTFADGLEGEVDLRGHLWGPVFERVRTPEGFAEVYVDDETGTITWPGEVDLAPDTLYIRVKTGEWPPGLNEEPKSA
ncbi:MAG TPA: DUF2442 domain-containing protein [Solirubrobacterales bacterium]|nr:DUF2442 domain-containing protein [Solirubrobacterales bacterium]